MKISIDKIIPNPQQPRQLSLKYNADRAIYRCRIKPSRSSFWTQEEHQFLAENLGILSHADIGRHIGRSANAVKIRQVRKGLPSASKQPGWLTGQQAAQILGIDIHSIMQLEERGLLPMEIIPGERKIRRIKKLRLYMWAINPEHWIYFRYEKVADQHLKRLLTLARERWGDEWWTTGQAARYFGVDCRCIHMRIMSGVLPAKRWGNWWVRRSDMLKFQIYPGRGESQRHKFTTGMDEFIMRAVDDLGYTRIHTARLMGLSTHLIAQRYQELKECQCVEI